MKWKQKDNLFKHIPKKLEWNSPIDMLRQNEHNTLCVNESSWNDEILELLLCIKIVMFYIYKV